MKYFTFLFLALSTFQVQLFGQSESTLWSDYLEPANVDPSSRHLLPSAFKSSHLEYSGLISQLSGVNKDRETFIVINLPMPDGTMERFEIHRNNVFPEELERKYPQIATYTGHSLHTPGRKVYLDFTTHGLHAMTRGGGATVYIEPFYKNDLSKYISYYKKDFERTEKSTWSCDFNHKAEKKKDQSIFPGIKPTRRLKAALETKEYELAVTVTGEYTAIFGGTVADGLSAVVTAVNRVTGVYESELGVMLTLVPDNDLLIFTDPNADPFSNSSGDLGLVTGVINGIIGASNYDIGHIFTSSNGGVAGLGVVCSGSKGRGLTGLPNPTGDPFYIDYVSHEMGHQFDATHTFNGNSGSCSGGNRTSFTAYEPGSGSTIMAYAGICGNDNLQNNSDAYFHLASLMQITDHVNGAAASCADQIDIDNNMPTSNANLKNVDGKKIPASTPFELIGGGSDSDGDALTYQWDEWDLGPQQDVSSGDNGQSPLFRSFDPSKSRRRTFPRLADLLTNTTVIGETLPTTNRTMDFQFIVRDNVGGWMSDVISLEIVSTAGPFLVTSQNTTGLISGMTDITWNVAGTDANGIDCGAVDILLSVNGGQSYQYTLADNIPNSGAATVTLPDIFTDKGRIKIICAGNVFFDVNNANMTIEPESVPCNVISEIDDDPIIDGLYSSASELVSSGVVPASGEVIFTGTTSLKLNADFEVKDSGLFEARIFPCTE